MSQTLFHASETFLQLNSFTGPGKYDMNGWLGLHPAKDGAVRFTWMPTGYSKPGEHTFSAPEMSNMLDNILIKSQSWSTLLGTTKIGGKEWGESVRYRCTGLQKLVIGFMLKIKGETRVDQQFSFQQEQVNQLTLFLCRQLGRNPREVCAGARHATFGL